METETINLVAILILLIMGIIIIDLIRVWYKRNMSTLEMNTIITRTSAAPHMINVVNVKDCEITDITFSDLMVAAKKIYNDWYIASPEIVEVNKRRVKLFNTQCERMGLLGVSKIDDLDNWSPIEKTV